MLKILFDISIGILLILVFWTKKFRKLFSLLLLISLIGYIWVYPIEKLVSTIRNTPDLLGVLLVLVVSIQILDGLIDREKLISRKSSE